MAKFRRQSRVFGENSRNQQKTHKKKTGLGARPPAENSSGVEGSAQADLETRNITVPRPIRDRVTIYREKIAQGSAYLLDSFLHLGPGYRAGLGSAAVLSEFPERSPGLVRDVFSVIHQPELSIVQRALALPV